MTSEYTKQHKNKLEIPTRGVKKPVCPTSATTGKGLFRTTKRSQHISLLKDSQTDHWRHINATLSQLSNWCTTYAKRRK